MRKIDELLLLTGSDIPFGAARVTIHQPRLKELGFIGEENFHIGSHFLLFDKNKLPDKDNSNLGVKSNFDIFMSVMNSKDVAKHRTDALMVLTLLFPDMNIKVETEQILLQNEKFTSSINDKNFSEFQSILAQMFCLEDMVEEDNEFDPIDPLAARIAQKIKKARQKRAEIKNETIKENSQITIYSKFISILTIGLQKNMNDFSDYTVYQLRDEFKRFTLKQNFDIYVQQKLAGAENVEEVENWMEDLHP